MKLIQNCGIAYEVDTKWWNSVSSSYKIVEYRIKLIQNGGIAYQVEKKLWNSVSS